MTQPAHRSKRADRGAAQAIAPGRRAFGRYDVERRIARGGSADVWLAHDDRLDRTVAIKAPHASLLPDPASRDRFVAEARAAAGLSHPAIVPVYDVVDDGSAAAIVLRHVDGETLADRIGRAGRLEVRHAVEIGADLAGALAHAHDAGVVHRDLKPGNVMLDAEGRAQLVDFGIAKSLLDAAPAGVAGGLVTGTLRYMAPEQLSGGAVDGRADLYALGLILFEMLTGRPVFSPTDPADLLSAQRRPLPPLPDRVPSSLRALVRALLAPDPSRRPATAGEVERRLRVIAHGLPSDAPPQRAAPTIAPGLPAASAGLAMLAATPSSREPAEVDEAVDAPSGSPATDRETIAFPSPPTVAVAAMPEVVPTPPKRAIAKGRRVRRDSRRRAALASGGIAALVVGAIALAVAIGGLGGRGAFAGALPTASAPDTASPSAASPTPAPAAVPVPVNHKGARGKGHGRGDGG